MRALLLSEEDLIRRRKDEWRHAQDVREMYVHKLRRTDVLEAELTQCLRQLQQRERELTRREQQWINLLNAYGLTKKTARVRHRLQKPMLLKAGERLLKGVIDPPRCGMNVVGNPDPLGYVPCPPYDYLWHRAQT